jgi:HK97 family phage major capsid protein
VDHVAHAAANRARAALDILDPPSALGLSSRETQQYSIFRAIDALRTRDFRRAGFELECSRTIYRQAEDWYLDRGIGSGTVLVPAEVLHRPLDDAARAMSTQPGGKGGYLIGNEHLGFVDVLRARAVLSRLGAQFVHGLTANATLVTSTGTVTVTWQAADGTSVTATDQALGQLSFAPHTAIAVTDVSEQTLAQGGTLAEQFFMTDLARATAVAVDKAGLVGAGGAEPIGIINTAGVTTGQDAASATYAKILAFPRASAAANATGAFAFAASAASAELLAQRSVFDGGSRPIWDGALTDGMCIGYPALASEQLPASTLIFGLWDEVIVADWGALAITLDRSDARFSSASVGIRAMWMVDVLIRRPAAFVVSTNLS